MQTSSIELKRLAKMKLSGKYSVPIGAFLIYMIISIMISSIIQIIVSPNSIYPSIIYLIITFIISLLETVFVFGLMKLYLDISRDNPLALGTLTYGFTHHPDRIIIVSLLVLLITSAWLVPGFVLLMVYLFVWSSPLLFLLFILTFIGGTILSVIYSLKYSQALFILVDNLDVSSIKALKESKKLMKGNLGRLFYLQVSFIGWFLLGLFSCGIGLIWIVPYMGVTSAHFYLDLKNSQSPSEQSTDFSHNTDTKAPEW